jgi:NAD(P)-dependent dehydrogenase (short-subunit alcohol dehydrogenase family)
VKGKTVVITGGTSGIGEVAAEALAQIGARIILVARSKSRAEATLARLRRSGPGAAHSVYFADLMRLAEMKRVAAEIAHTDRLAILARFCPGRRPAHHAGLRPAELPGRGRKKNS